MPAIAFTDQRERLRRIVESALAGATYESSREEDGRLLVIEARRPAGGRVYLRFRGVQRSESTQALAPGSSLRLASVGSPGGSSLLDLVLPFLRFFRTRSNALRVRIEAGAARLDILCEDAEWWEEEAAANPANGDGI